MGFDYSNSASYFITICTAHRQKLFWTDAYDGSLSETGKIADEEILALPDRFPLTEIDKYVIMPDHVHMIITLLGALPGTDKKTPNIANIVGAFKAKVTFRCTDGHDRPAVSIWQKSFYDHVIRNDKEYSDTWNYIDGNPRRIVGAGMTAPESPMTVPETNE